NRGGLVREVAELLDHGAEPLAVRLCRADALAIDRTPHLLAARRVDGLRGQMKVDAGRLIFEPEKIQDRSGLPLRVVNQILVANLENSAGRGRVDGSDR